MASAPLGEPKPLPSFVPTDRTPTQALTPLTGSARFPVTASLARRRPQVVQLEDLEPVIAAGVLFGGALGEQNQAAVDALVVQPLPDEPKCDN